MARRDIKLAQGRQVGRRAGLVVLFLFFLLPCTVFAEGGVGSQSSEGGVGGLALKLRRFIDNLSLTPSHRANEPKQLPITAEEKRINQMLDDPNIYAFPFEEEPVQENFKLNKSTQVSFLCYHDFTRVERMKRDMIVHEDDLRTQMQALKDGGIEVVSMSDFLAWRRGEKNIPDPSVVITIDDGWQAVHSVAYPIFKEFGYPFTIYLYQQYVDIGGRSLSRNQIMEMMENGAEIGSHSVSHRDLTNRKGKSPELYKKFLRAEMQDSVRFLEDFLGVKVSTFAYPYGTYSQEIIDLGQEIGYEALFTVNGQKATWDIAVGEIGRFVVHGDDPGNFRLATSFRGRVNSTDNMLIDPRVDPSSENSLISTTPEPGQVITERMPEISVDVSALEGIVSESISMRISGIGRVIPHYNQQDGIIRYRIRQPLRNKQYTVQVRLEQESEDKPRLIPWKFSIQREAAYFNAEDTFSPTPN